MPDRRRRVVILGAAGRDFHCFNQVYRGDSGHEVVAFTATQIPGIDDRRYPATLAGPLYPDGIPIREQFDLESLCRHEAIDLVVFAYSDVTHPEVMHVGSRALACGADFMLLGPRSTMLQAQLPVIAVSAVRTGCGKSQTARWITQQLRDRGIRTAAIRHPMPYGDLEEQRVQRFETRADIDAADCTAEEREEYELYVDAGAVIFAGVDYGDILEAAQREARIIVWDGGNNDFPFIRPDLHIVVVDALRPEQVDTHHPGEAALRMADLVLINKTDAASAAATGSLREAVQRIRPDVPVLRAASPVHLDDPAAVRGRRVIVVEDGPTTTHGGMGYGAGYVAAVEAGAAQILDPRDGATPALAAVFRQYPHIGKVLPAMGYGADQIRALRATIEASGADVVVTGSPIDLAALLDVDVPVVRARYAFQDVDDPGLAGALESFLGEHLRAASS